MFIRLIYCNNKCEVVLTEIYISDIIIYNTDGLFNINKGF